MCDRQVIINNCGGNKMDRKNIENNHHKSHAYCSTKTVVLAYRIVCASYNYCVFSSFIYWCSLNSELCDLLIVLKHFSIGFIRLICKVV